jgi:hypothetical protein
MKLYLAIESELFKMEYMKGVSYKDNVGQYGCDTAVMRGHSNRVLLVQDKPFHVSNGVLSIQIVFEKDLSEVFIDWDDYVSVECENDCTKCDTWQQVKECKGFDSISGAYVLDIKEEEIIGIGMMGLDLNKNIDFVCIESSSA